jgi:hypothetical protein
MGWAGDLPTEVEPVYGGTLNAPIAATEAAVTFFLRSEVGY